MQRILLVIGAVLLSGTALAGGHKVVKPMVPIDVNPKIEKAVQEVVYDTARRWNSQDFATLLELWDPNEEFPTYLAEEQAQWFVGWPRLREYLDPPRPNPAVEAIRETMYDIQVKEIGPGLAIAIWEMDFEMKVIASNPIHERVRVSAVLRETDNGWKYIHWAESPQTAMVYIENLYEKEISDDWDEFFEQAQKDKKEVWRKKREAQKKARQ